MELMPGLRCSRTRELTNLLRQFRRRIDPRTDALGPYRRRRSKRGKAVTQEELAEHIGVSRTWYCQLESRRVRVSVLLLERLCAALMLTDEERSRLFVLALPELDFVRWRKACMPETVSQDRHSM
jgi:transcriptional regulator with XRE-family HTH domain